MFNNAVYARNGNAYERGDPIGYRCYRCRGIYDAMWGDTCNECREKERRHKEMIAAIEKRNTHATARPRLGSQYLASRGLFFFYLEDLVLKLAVWRAIGENGGAILPERKTCRQLRVQTSCPMVSRRPLR